MDNEALKTHIAALQSGDRNAFEEIYSQLKTPVYTIIFRILYDRAQAEDLMQEVFLRLYVSPPDSRVLNPRAWIFQTARNLAIDGKRRSPHSPLSDEVTDTHPLEEAIGIRLDVEAALRGLSREDREIVTLYLNAGLKFREIAMILQKPLGTVLWRYRRAVGRLRAELSGGML